MVIGSFANGLNKMSDDKRERLRLDAAAAKEESLLRKLVTLLDKEGIVKFKKIQILDKDDDVACQKLNMHYYCQNHSPTNLLCYNSHAKYPIWTNYTLNI
jgi:hypothetical protein